MEALSARRLSAPSPAVFASKPKSSTSRAVIPRLHHVCFRYSLVTRDHPFDGLIGRLQSLGFPPQCPDLPVRLWNILPPAWQRPVCSPLDPFVQNREITL